jgi:hypothetical protein
MLQVTGAIDAHPMKNDFRLYDARLSDFTILDTLLRTTLRDNFTYSPRRSHLQLIMVSFDLYLESRGLSFHPPYLFPRTLPY